MESLIAHIARKEREHLAVKKVDIDERPDIAARFKVGAASVSFAPPAHGALANRPMLITRARQASGAVMCTLGASLLFAQGRNAVQVQRWLGHHSAAFTLATYVHLLDGDLGEPLSLSVSRALEDDATGTELGLAELPTHVVNA